MRDNDKLTTCVVNVSKTFSHPDVIGSTYNTARIFHPVGDPNYKFSIYTGENTYCLENNILRMIYNDQRTGYTFPCYRYADGLKLCPSCPVDVWVNAKAYGVSAIFLFAISVIIAI